MIQRKLDWTDSVKLATSEQLSRTNLIPTVTFHGPSENIRPLANESVKHCINGVVHATLLSVADFGCFRLSINNVRVQPVRFIGHRAKTWPANHTARDVPVASALVIGAVPCTKQ